MRPADLTPEERFLALACILATGLAHLRSRRGRPADFGPIVAFRGAKGRTFAERKTTNYTTIESLSSALELRGHKIVTVSTRVYVFESRRGPTIPNRRSR